MMHERERDRMERAARPTRRFCDVCLTFHERPQFQAYRPAGRDFTTGDKLWVGLLIAFIGLMFLTLHQIGAFV